MTALQAGEHLDFLANPAQLGPDWTLPKVKWAPC